MKPQHLSDEAVAAFADGVLSGHARDRAARHLNACAECRGAVREQREAAVALRTAPAPALPTNLLDKLRTVPLTAPLPAPPAAVDRDGTALFASLAPVAAFAPATTPRGRHRSRTYLTAAVLAGVTGAIVAGGVAGATDDDSPAQPIRTVNHVPGGAAHSPAMVGVFRGGSQP